MNQADSAWEAFEEERAQWQDSSTSLSSSYFTTSDSIAGPYANGTSGSSSDPFGDSFSAVDQFQNWSHDSSVSSPATMAATKVLGFYLMANAPGGV